MEHSFYNYFEYSRHLLRLVVVVGFSNCADSSSTYDERQLSIIENKRVGLCQIPVCDIHRKIMKVNKGKTNSGLDCPLFDDSRMLQAFGLSVTFRVI